MTNPTDHELIKVLARVAGIEVRHPHEWSICIDSAASRALLYMKADRNGHHPTWDPLRDANQMEMVKAKLREIPGMQYGSDYCDNQEGKWHTGYVYHRRGIDFDPPVFYGTAEDKSELRAFALAVHVMEQGKEAHG